MDKDGRLAVPTELLAQLRTGATVTRGIERCLLVYPTDEWHKLAEKLENALPLTSRPARAFRRLMFSGALVCVLDDSGQMRLPERLRRYASIEDEVVVVGLVSHLEIWSPGQWQELSAELAEGGVALAEELGRFGI
jgi:MraZ protein